MQLHWPPTTIVSFEISTLSIQNVYETVSDILVKYRFLKTNIIDIFSLIREVAHKEDPAYQIGVNAKE